MNAKLKSILTIGLVSSVSIFALGAQKQQKKERVPHLTISDGARQERFTQIELLHSPHVKLISIKRDPHYKKAMNFHAISVRDLFAPSLSQISPRDEIEFRALDGFAAPINAGKLLTQSKNKANAYIAIENPAHPWPAFAPHALNVGPFYLVWTNPEKSHIPHNEWVLQLASLTVKASFAKMYPRILPPVHSSAAIEHGFQVFRDNCFACHKINAQGVSNLGPDLNLPMNPTDYLKPRALRALIRDPAKVRTWPARRMPGVGSEISDRDLSDLIQYLQVMKHHH